MYFNNILLIHFLRNYFKKIHRNSRNFFFNTASLSNNFFSISTNIQENLISIIKNGRDFYFLLCKFFCACSFIFCRLFNITMRNWNFNMPHIAVLMCNIYEENKSKIFIYFFQLLLIDDVLKRILKMYIHLTVYKLNDTWASILIFVIINYKETICWYH